MTIQRDITKAVFKHHNIAFDSKTFAAFWELEYSIVAVKDEHCNVKDLLGDCFDPVVNSGIDPFSLKREEKAERARISRKGVWGCGLAIKGEPLWESFTWGFVGDDFIGSMHDVDLLNVMETKAKLVRVAK